MAEVLSPSPQLLIKLGSVIVHYQEYLSDNGNPVDKISAESILSEDEVNDWIKNMDKLSLLPKKRTNPNE